MIREHFAFRDWDAWLKDITTADLSTYLDQHTCLLENQLKKYYPHEAQQRLEWNRPFLKLSPSSNRNDEKHAVILLHGFTASPYIMRSVAQIYHRAGFSVFSLLLPGHGTSHEDLLHVTQNHWETLVHFAIEQLEQQGYTLHLCGFSLGATLALNIIQNKPVKSLAFFSPALGITRAAHLLPFVQPFKPWPGLKKSQWLIKPFAHRSLANYQTTPVNGAYQVLKSIQACQIALKNKRHPGYLTPTFCVATEQDKTVKPSKVLHFFNQNQSTHSRLLWYSNQPEHLAPQSPRIQVVNSRFSNTILAQSHVSVLVDPNDEYYGIEGGLHTNLTPDTRWTEITLERHNVKRLTFNPDFPNMARQLATFLQTCTQTEAQQGR